MLLSTFYSATENFSELTTGIKSDAGLVVREKLVNMQIHSVLRVHQGLDVNNQRNCYMMPQYSTVKLEHPSASVIYIVFL